MKILLLSPGRTGSVMLGWILSQAYDLKMVHQENANDRMELIKYAIDNFIIHSHDVFSSEEEHQTPVEEITLIISKRRMMFDAIMSMIVAKNVNEYDNYQKHIDPFTVEIEDFISHYCYYYWFYNNINLSLPYKDIITIYYEDVINEGFHVIKQKLNKPFVNIPSFKTQKSLNNYKNIIINHHSLYELFLDFEKNNRYYRYFNDKQPRLNAMHKRLTTK